MRTYDNSSPTFPHSLWNLKREVLLDGKLEAESAFGTPEYKYCFRTAYTEKKMKPWNEKNKNNARYKQASKRRRIVRQESKREPKYSFLFYH